jgi:hypothetical protein
MFRLTLSQSDSTGAQDKHPMSLSPPFVNVLRRFSVVQEKVNIRLVVLPFFIIHTLAGKQLYNFLVSDKAVRTCFIINHTKHVCCAKR